MSLSDRSFFDTFKEAGALGKHVAKAKQTGSSELVRELADVHGTGFGVTTAPDVVERETLEALHTAKDERSSRRRPTSSSPIGSSSSRSHSPSPTPPAAARAAESGAIEKVRSALA